MSGFPLLGIPDTGDTAWMLISAALVLLMTVGLAFFYGGMVRAKSVLNMLMMSFGAMGVVTVLWVLYCYSMTFGDDVDRTVGNPAGYFGLEGIVGGGAPAGSAGVEQVPLVGSIPQSVFVAFQLMFAIITVALITGAVAERMKFGSWLLFAAGWVTVGYFPVAHWVFAVDGLAAARGGWIVNKLHAIDFAGGTAVHINAGTAALVLTLLLGRRHGWPARPMRPHNLPLVMLGAGLLWFGWYGFNCGSTLGANGATGTVFITTTAAAAAGMLSWLLTERLRDGHATSLGGASGTVAGLVAITPACSAVDVPGALLIGAAGGALCALAVGIKYRFGFDDSLDVVGVHLVGGLAGTLLVGLVAAPDSPALAGATGVSRGLFYGGGVDQLVRQAVGAFSVLGYSAAVTAIVALIVKLTVGLRVDVEHEAVGLDEAQHAEKGYDFAVVRAGSARDRRGWEERADEADHRDRETHCGGPGEGRTGADRGTGDDGHRGAGLRPSERTH